MKHLFNAGIATALFFVFCAVVHLPYFFLTRLHVIEPCASMSMTISILGTMICIVEVIYFGYLLARANLDCSAKGAVWSILFLRQAPVTGADLRGRMPWEWISGAR